MGRKLIVGMICLLPGAIRAEDFSPTRLNHSGSGVTLLLSPTEVRLFLAHSPLIHPQPDWIHSRSKKIPSMEITTTPIGEPRESTDSTPLFVGVKAKSPDATYKRGVVVVLLTCQHEDLPVTRMFVLQTTILAEPSTSDSAHRMGGGDWPQGEYRLEGKAYLQLDPGGPVSEIPVPSTRFSIDSKAGEIANDPENQNSGIRLIAGWDDQNLPPIRDQLFVGRSIDLSKFSIDPKLDSLTIRESLPKGVFQKSDRIRHLDLSFSILSDRTFQSISNLKRLKLVNIAGTQINSFRVEQLAKLHGLETVDLSDVHFQRDPIAPENLLEPLVRCQWTHLSLAGSSVRNQDLVHLAKLPLKSLNLSYTIIGDEGLESLKNHEMLEELNLVKTRIGKRGLKVLAELPNLKRVHLDPHLRVEELKQRGIEVVDSPPTRDLFAEIWEQIR